MGGRFLLSAALAAVAALAGPVAGARGAAWSVASGDSLRSAIEASNRSREADAIHVAPGFFALGGLEVRGGGLTITGSGAGATTISAGGGTRVLSVSGGASATLTDLAVTGGRAREGGGIAVDDVSQLALLNVSVAGNRAAASGLEGAAGGGVFNAGRLVIVNSTVSANVAESGSGSAGNGGGIASSGVLEVANSTISDNVAAGVAAAGGRGGGIHSFGGRVVLTSTTLAANRASGPGSGGNVFLGAGRAIYKNTIIAGGAARYGANCAGEAEVTRVGRNLESADTCELGDGDVTNADARLGPLAPNGGATPTRALLAGSPAFDGALGCPAVGTDQRGIARPQGLACDIGAFEGPPGVGALWRDSSAPVIRSLSVRGGRVSFRLSERATARFRVVRAGRRRAGFTRTGRTGLNRFRLARGLPAGSYRLVVSATDRAGNRSAAKTKRFRVVQTSSPQPSGPGRVSTVGTTSSRLA